jgi:hypothetical protein
MGGQAGFLGGDERLAELSAKGNHAEPLNRLIDFDPFRPEPDWVVRARAGRRKAGPPSTPS